MIIPTLAGRVLACAILLTLCACSVSASSRRASGSEDYPLEIRRMMSASAAAWNAGDLSRFMEDFAPDTGTTFIGRRGVLRGRDQIRAAYSPRFAGGARPDSLRFEDLEVHTMGPELAYVIAYYVLHRGDSVTARGPTTLVVRRNAGRWRIVHDHSS
jgi:uncharacterized protein (TIGR02246 family)